MNTSALVSERVSRWRPAFVLAIFVLAGFGFAYSIAGAALGRMLFPHAATGSLVERDGKVVGSALVAQPFADMGRLAVEHLLRYIAKPDTVPPIETIEPQLVVRASTTAPRR